MAREHGSRQTTQRHSVARAPSFAPLSLMADLSAIRRAATSSASVASRASAIAFRSASCATLVAPWSAKSRIEATRRSASRSNASTAPLVADSSLDSRACCRSRTSEMAISSSSIATGAVGCAAPRPPSCTARCVPCGPPSSITRSASTAMALVSRWHARSCWSRALSLADCSKRRSSSASQPATVACSTMVMPKRCPHTRGLGQRTCE